MTVNPAHTHIPEWTFGDRIRKVRTEMGLTQAEFAELIQVGQSALKQWETSRNRPQDIVSIAKRIQLATGIPADWVLGIEKSPTEPVGPNGGLVCATRDSNPQPSDPKVAHFPVRPNLLAVA